MVALALPIVGSAQVAGDVDPAFNPKLEINGSIRMIASQPDGKRLIGGVFSRIAGTTRQSVARLNADGSLDASFIPPAGLGAAVALAAGSDGKIVVETEAFTSTDRSIYAVARLNADGSPDTSFAQATLGNQDPFASQPAIALQADGKTLVGGAFSTVNGAARLGLVRLNADGSVDIGFNPAVNSFAGVRSISSLVPLANGKTVASGIWLGADSSVRYVFRLNGDGSLDSSFNAPAQRTSFALTLQPDGKLLYLTVAQPSGQTNYGFPRRLNADGSQDTTFIPQFDASAVLTALALQPDGKVLVGGTLSVASVPDANGNVQITPRTGVARLNPDGSADISFSALDQNASVNALNAQTDGKILVGGAFTNFANLGRIGLGRLNITGTPDTGFNADATDVSANSALAFQPDGKLIVLGNARRLNGVQVNNGLARFNLDGSLDTVFKSTPLFVAGANPKDAIVVQPNGQIVVIANSPSQSSKGLLNYGRFNANGTPDSTFNINLFTNAFYAAAAQPDGKLILAGYEGFEEDLPYPINRFNADGSFDRSFIPAADPATQGQYTNSSKIYAVALQPDGKVLAAGALKPVAGVPRAGIIRLNANGSLDTSFNVNPGGAQSSDSVLAVALQPDGKVLVGGSFAAIGGASHPNLARLNADGSLDASFNPGAQANLTVRAIALQVDGKVVIGGDFSQVNGVGRNGVARLNADGTLDASFDPGTGTGGTGSVSALAVARDGSILIGGDFTKFNELVRDGIAKLFGAKALPIVVLESDAPAAYPAQGIQGSFKITRASDDLSQPLTVTFTIKGTAINGTDYKTLTLTKTIKAGKAFKRINVLAFNPANPAIAKKTVKITLQPSDAYKLGDATVAKLKIFYNP